MKSFYGVMVQINISNTLSYFQLFIAPLNNKKIRSLTVKIKEKNAKPYQHFDLLMCYPGSSILTHCNTELSSLSRGLI